MTSSPTVTVDHLRALTGHTRRTVLVAVDGQLRVITPDELWGVAAKATDTRIVCTAGQLKDTLSWTPGGTRITGSAALPALAAECTAVLSAALNGRP